MRLRSHNKHDILMWNKVFQSFLPGSKVVGGEEAKRTSSLEHPETPPDSSKKRTVIIKKKNKPAMKTNTAKKPDLGETKGKSAVIIKRKPKL